MKSLGEALVAAQQKMPVVHKNGRANYGAYVTLDELISKTRPVLNSHGLAITQFPAETTTGGPGLKTLLIHAESGETLESTVPLLLNGKHDMQALGGAITYARRYGWAAVLGIANDEDDEGNHVSSPVDRAKSGASSDASGAGVGDMGKGSAVSSSAADPNFTLPFGKHKGKTIAEVDVEDPGWLDWFLENGKKDDIKAAIQAHRDGSAEAGLEAVGATLLDDDSIPF